MKHLKKLLMLSVTGLLTFASPVLVANAGWKSTSAGMMYTQTAAAGYMTGLNKIDDNYYIFGSNGILQTGAITYKGKQYYADPKTGALIISKWVTIKNAQYYFTKDGTMAISTWVEGKYLGADGKFTGKTRNYGWVTSSGKTYYYDSNGSKVKGFLTVSGKKYYFSKSTSALIKSKWVTVSGKKYYADSKGVIQTNTWKDKKYLTSTGAAASGMTTIGDSKYYFNKSTFNYTTGWFKYSGAYYYANTNGKLQKSAWISNKKYYVNSSYKRSTGLVTINKEKYYFNKTTGVKLTNTMKAINSSDTYYFGPDGAALTKKWVKIKSKYYYFQSTGKMAKNAFVGKYYVGSDGARTTKTGWVTSDGKKYYLNSSGKKVTGLQTISSKKYYFNSEGVMQTGLQTVNGKKYFFDSKGVMATGIQTANGKKYYFNSDGTLAVSTSIIVGGVQYTIDGNGVVTKETSLSISGNTKGVEIVNYAIKFVGNPYVYGGTSLTNGADCSGFVQTIFKKYGYTLLRVADDQMKGPSSTYINKNGYTPAVTVAMSDILPGDLLFFGSGNYASHVVIYMGNDKIVHASNSQPYPKGGIKISTLSTYGQKPLKAVRYWS